MMLRSGPDKKRGERKVCLCIMLGPSGVEEAPCWTIPRSKSDRTLMDGALDHTHAKPKGSLEEGEDVFLLGISPTTRPIFCPPPHTIVSTTSGAGCT